MLSWLRNFISRMFVRLPDATDDAGSDLHAAVEHLRHAAISNERASTILKQLIERQ